MFIYLPNLLLYSCLDLAIKGAALVLVILVLVPLTVVVVVIVLVVEPPTDDEDDPPEVDEAPFMFGIWFLIVFVTTVAADIALLFAPPGRTLWPTNLA